MNSQSRTRNQETDIVKTLLIEDNTEFAQRLSQTLTRAKGLINVRLQRVNRLSSGLELLDKENFDIVLLDLSLPESQGVGTFTKVYSRAPEVPIIVLIEPKDETIAMDTIHKGAQDYLIKAEIDKNMIMRSVRYAIEHKHMIEKMQSLYLQDGLTGLYNRRGFITLSLQQLKMAHRLKGDIFLLFLDLDNLKSINDTLGHPEGDRALIAVADILQKTFRRSDVIGRIGGDEFAVLAMEASESSTNRLVNRFEENLEAYNSKRNSHHKLSLSMGLARYDPERTGSIDELLLQADRLMYEQKRKKQRL
jgi:two-component system cell cycle response regulator